jgi:hypothetical protein
MQQKKKKKKRSLLTIKTGTSSGHITKLKQGLYYLDVYAPILLTLATLDSNIVKAQLEMIHGQVFSHFTNDQQLPPKILFYGCSLQVIDKLKQTGENLAEFSTLDVGVFGYDMHFYS